MFLCLSKLQRRTCRGNSPQKWFRKGNIPQNVFYSDLGIIVSSAQAITPRYPCIKSLRGVATPFLTSRGPSLGGHFENEKNCHDPTIPLAEGTLHSQCSIDSPNFIRSIQIPLMARWWFQICFIFTPTWGNDQNWLIFFKWVETTN